MCRAKTIEGGFHHPSPSRRLDVRAFYLRLSSCSTAAPAPAELTLVYHPTIGGAALVLNGSALPPAAPAEVTLRRVAGDACAYASADRVVAAEGARFEVRAAGEEVVAAEGAFVARRRGGEGWRVECRRGMMASVLCVAEVVVLADGGVLMRDKARAAGRMRCGVTRLEGIPEETTDLGGCGACSDDDGWEVVGDASDDGEPWKQEEEGDGEVEMETVRWAMEMGVWAVCLGVGILATARRFRRKRAFW